VSGPRPRRVAVCPAIKRKNCCSGDSREDQELETKPPLLLWNDKQETGEQPGQEQDAGLGGTIAQLDRTGDEFGLIETATNRRPRRAAVAPPATVEKTPHSVNYAVCR
jgi:hypothetical protein